MRDVVTVAGAQSSRRKVPTDEESSSRRLTIRHISSLENEDLWSNILATLIERNPRAVKEFFGLDEVHHQTMVWRELSQGRHDDGDSTTAKGDRLRDRTDIVWAGDSARPNTPHDREGWESILAQGAPSHVGIGFGDAQDKISGRCLFGVRFQLQPDVELSGLQDKLQGQIPLLLPLTEIS